MEKLPDELIAQVLECKIRTVDHAHETQLTFFRPRACCTCEPSEGLVAASQTRS
jgi:hypothetical protein